MVIAKMLQISLVTALLDGNTLVVLYKQQAFSSC